MLSASYGNATPDARLRRLDGSRRGVRAERGLLGVDEDHVGDAHEAEQAAEIGLLVAADDNCARIRFHEPGHASSTRTREMESSLAALLLITSRFAIAVSAAPLSWRSSARSGSIKRRPSVSRIAERTMLDVEDLRTFIEGVDAGGLTPAAHRLGISKSIVSHRPARLESELGAQLLVRTTRGIGLTEAGATFRNVEHEAAPNFPRASHPQHQ